MVLSAFSAMTGTNYNTNLKMPIGYTMFKPVEKDVYTWSVPDAEFGEMMNGHLFIQDDGYALIDPPLMPDLLNSLGVFGKCKAVILLSGSHKRGSFMASGMLGAPLYVPEFAAVNFNLPNAKPYKNGDNILGELHAIEIKSEIGVFGEHPIHEMVLVDSKKRAFISDVCYGHPSGRLNFAPEEVIPGHSPEQVRASIGALIRALPSGINTAFFGHGTDIKGEFSKQVELRRKEFNL